VKYPNKTKNIINKTIKVRIIYNNTEISDKNTNSENSKIVDDNNESLATTIEINIYETINNLIKKYCEITKKEGQKLYLTKSDYKKLKNNLTIEESAIKNNDTLYIFKEKNNIDKDKEENKIINKDEITFKLRYQNNKYTFNGKKTDLFVNCIKSFFEEFPNKTFTFILVESILQINKSLEELNIKNGSVIRAAD
jgi:hypothetical protein